MDHGGSWSYLFTFSAPFLGFWGLMSTAARPSFFRKTEARPPTVQRSEGHGVLPGRSKAGSTSQQPRDNLQHRGFTENIRDNGV